MTGPSVGGQYRWRELTMKFIGKRKDFPELSADFDDGRGYIFILPDGKYVELSFPKLFEIEEA